MIFKMQILNQIIDGIVDTIVSEYKDCPKCGLPKLKNCFYKKKASKDGLQNTCKGCVKAHNAKHYEENKVAIAEQQAGYRQENKVAIAEQTAGYRQENKAKRAEYDAKHYQEHKDEIKAHNAKPETKAKRNANKRDRRKTDEGFRIETNLRCRLYQAMGGEKKSASTKELVGLQSGTAINDYFDLKSPWLKEQGVSSEELVTDHIIPCAEYKLEKPDHQKACFHYINLQRLTNTDNMKKGDRVPVGFDFKSTLKMQLDLIARIEKEKLTYHQVLDMQKAGQLYEVKGYEV